MKTFPVLCLGLAFGAGAASLAGQSADVPQRTTIQSDALEMQGTETRNHFYFRGNVHVEGADLEIFCQELTVTALRESGPDEGTLGEFGAVERIVAVGNVHIEQAGREAFAGRVEVDPAAGTIRFLENPVIIQGDAEARAYGFVFYTEDKRIEAMNPPGFAPGQRERATISLSGATQLSVNVPETSRFPGMTPGTPSEDAAEATDPTPAGEGDESDPAPATRPAEEGDSPEGGE